MERLDRLHVKLRVRDGETVPTVIDLFPTADFQEREIYDMFGVVFDGHPDLRRILMPEDYEGHPQRRDFPIGGGPVLFTYNETRAPPGGGGREERGWRGARFAHPADRPPRGGGGRRRLAHRPSPARR